MKGILQSVIYERLRGSPEFYRRAQTAIAEYRIYAALAQQAEHPTRNGKRPGSRPGGSTRHTAGTCWSGDRQRQA